MSQSRPSVLITAVGGINVLIGLVFVGFGIYVFLVGGDAVATLFQVRTEVGKAANVVAGKDGAAQAREVAGNVVTGLGSVLLAFAVVLAGCSIVQGLPNLLVGVGVLMRSNVARVFAIVFAVLALFEGLACLSATGQSSRFLYAGLFLVAYAILTFVALFGKRASFEFSGGLKRAAPPNETQAMNADVPPRPTASAIQVVLILLLVATSATAATFATLYFTRPAGDPALGQFPWPRLNPGDDQKIPPIDDTRTLALHKPKLAAFHDAVLAGQVPRAAELLKDVDVDEPDEVGRTALMKVSATGNLRAAMFLIGTGAQLNQCDKEGKAALIHAALANQAGMIEILRGGANAQEDIRALRAQYMKLSRAGPDIHLKELLGANFTMPSVNFKAADNKGMTAYMYAILKGHLDCAYQLDVGGGNSRTDYPMDSKANTLLHLLAAEGNLKMLRHIQISTHSGVWSYYPSPGDTAYLWKACGLKQTNAAGQEAWMIAAEKGHLEAVKYLLPTPTLADLQAKDNAGKTGAALAKENGHQSVVAYLIELEAELTKKAAEAKKGKDGEKKK